MLGGASCALPVSWHGDWYESDVGRVTITTTDISSKGTCVDNDHDFYLLENRLISIIYWTYRPSFVELYNFVDGDNFTP